MTDTGNRAGDPYTPASGKRAALYRAGLELESTRAQVQRWHDAQVTLLVSALGHDSEAYILATAALQEESTRRIGAARAAFRARVAEEISSSWTR